MRNRYSKLWLYIKDCGEDNIIVTFGEIAKITGFPIDHSFLQNKKELLEYGYEVGKISMKNESVSFHKLS